MLNGQTAIPQLLIRIGLAPSSDDQPTATPWLPLDEVFHHPIERPLTGGAGTFASQ
jgi:hypothetical protein